VIGNKNVLNWRQEKAGAFTPWLPLSRERTQERGGKKEGSRKIKRKDGLNRGWPEWKDKSWIMEL